VDLQTLVLVKLLALSMVEVHVHTNNN